MLKANQEALNQQTNIGLLNIRQIELNYYTLFYSSFSGQSALICGFVYSSVTQMGYGGNVPYASPLSVMFGREIGHLILSLFWVTSAICIMSALHTIFCSTLILTLGPGKAIFGKVGSMNPANEGMRNEMKQIILSYLVMVGSFAVSTLCSFWVVMELIPALVCTFITFVAARYWYVYSERIYNRFQFDGMWVGRALTEDANVVHYDSDDDDPLRALDLGEGASIPGAPKELRMVALSKSNDPSSSAGEKKGGIRSILGLGQSSRFTANPMTSPSSPALSVPSSSGSKGSLATRLTSKLTSSRERNSAVRIQGYISKKSSVKLLGYHVRNEWRRRYFVLYTNGNLFYYRTNKDAPNRPLKEKPIQVFTYCVHDTLSVSCSIKSGTCADDESDTDSSSVASTSSPGSASGYSQYSKNSPASPQTGKLRTPSIPSFDIFLIPDDDVYAILTPGSPIKQRVWQLRPDTQKEQQEWLVALRGCDSSNLKDPHVGSQSVAGMDSPGRLGSSR